MNDFYSYMQKNELAHTYYIIQPPKGVPKTQRIVEM